MLKDDLPQDPVDVTQFAARELNARQTIQEGFNVASLEDKAAGGDVEQQHEDLFRAQVRNILAESEQDDQNGIRK